MSEPLPQAKSRKPWPARTLRRAILDMKVKDALEYVLDAYERIAGCENELEEIASEFSLTPTQAVMFRMLNREVGAVVSFSVLSAAVKASSSLAEVDGPDTTRTHLMLLRKRLKGRYVIRNVWGKGYVLEPCTDRAEVAA